MKKRLIVKKDNSKKTGNVYVALVMDFGYRREFLNSTPQLCAEMLGVSVAEIFGLENGEYVVLEDNV